MTKKPNKNGVNSPLTGRCDLWYNIGVVREKEKRGAGPPNGGKGTVIMGEELKLEKGDTAFVCLPEFKTNGNGSFVYVGYKYVVVTVAIKRNLKFGKATYFVDRSGNRMDCSFDSNGWQNFKNWRDSVWCNYSKRLFDNERDAKNYCNRTKKEAKEVA